MSEVRGGGREELPHPGGQGTRGEELSLLQGAADAWAQEGQEELLPHSRLGEVAVRRYPSSKVRSSSCALLEQL